MRRTANLLLCAQRFLCRVVFCFYFIALFFRCCRGDVLGKPLSTPEADPLNRNPTSTLKIIAHPHILSSPFAILLVCIEPGFCDIRGDINWRRESDAVRRCLRSEAESRLGRATSSPESARFAAMPMIIPADRSKRPRSMHSPPHYQPSQKFMI